MSRWETLIVPLSVEKAFSSISLLPCSVLGQSQKRSKSVRGSQRRSVCLLSDSADHLKKRLGTTVPRKMMSLSGFSSCSVWTLSILSLLLLLTVPTTATGIRSNSIGTGKSLKDGWSEGDFIDEQHVANMPLTKPRKNSNTTFAYKPIHIPFEQCQYWNESECQERDQEHGLFLARQRRKLQVDGTFNVLVLPMYFPEHANIQNQLPTVGYLNTLLNDESFASSVNPIGSVAQWFNYNSYGKLKLNFIVQDWAVTPQSESYYANGNSGYSDSVRLAEMINGRLQELDNQGGDNFWIPFDREDDGDLDAVAVFTSGIPGELGQAQCAPPAQERIGAQQVGGWRPGFWTSSSGLYRLGPWTVNSAFTRPLCNPSNREERAFTPTTMAIFTHEFGHILGLPDLYDDDTDEPDQGIAGVGAFDIMCYTYGWTNDGARPGYFSAYSKILLGWLEPIEITSDGYYVIQPAEVSRQIYKISEPYPDGEYLLLEHRKPIKWGDNLSGEGLVVYHIDENAPGQTNRGYPGKNGWPGDHYEVAVLQADGLYEIEKLESAGDAGDFYTEGMTLGPDTNTWPNTASYQNGLIQTGLSITVTAQNDYVLQFRVQGFRSFTQSNNDPSQRASGWMDMEGGGSANKVDGEPIVSGSAWEGAMIRETNNGGQLDDRSPMKDLVGSQESSSVRPGLNRVIMAATSGVALLIAVASFCV